jgi:putative glycosyltransferase (TIGR04348 family)
MARTAAAPTLVLVTPALADANNGNWQTARRWAQMLGGHYRLQLCAHWDGLAGDQAAAPAVAMIALHARRSAASIAAWKQRYPDRPLILVLTGTDLYRDIDSDAAAQRSLDLADRLVVLNERGALRLPPPLRERTTLCLQSARALKPAEHPPTRQLRALMVGHLREEKSPQTCFDAMRRLAGRPDIRLDHIGAALDPALGAAAAALQADCPQYRWLGALPHAVTRRRIRDAHLLVHTSRMEGGAHVVTEAIVSGTPVLASRIDGNLGLLGADYAGCFDWGDDAALATLLERARDDAAMLPALRAQCAARAPLFAPEHERAVLLNLLADVLHATPAPGEPRP